MNYKKITQPSIDQNYSKLIDGIIKKAQELSTKSIVINRRELVNYLNSTYNLDVKEGIHIRDFIKAAYTQTSYSKSIQEALVNNIIENDGKNRVYNPNRVEDNIFCLDIQAPNLNIDNFDLISNQSQEIKDTDGFSLTKEVINKIDLLKVEKTISITGSSKVESYKEHAFKIKKGYEEIIRTYEYVKDINLNLISDFETTRNKLKLIREDLLNLLIDLFGDSIKTTEPEMFNFSEISWSDYEDTYPKLDLFHNIINNEIELFKNFHSQQMSAISSAGKFGVKNFLNSTEKISKSKGHLTKSDIKGTAAVAAADFLVQGGMALIKSRSQSKKTIAQIELDIEKLKQGMQSDVEKIMNDILKLGKLHTEINDKLIPQLNLFTNKVAEIIVNKISPLYNKIIKNIELKNFRDKNKELTIEERQIKSELIDRQKQLEYSNYVHSELSSLVESQIYEHEYVQSLHPELPKGFYKFISPTNSKKLYNETLDEWNSHCKPFIENHQKLKEEIETEENLIKINNDEISKLKLREITIKTELRKNTEEINIIFKSSNTSKEILIDLLSAIKEVSVSSKSVLEVNLSNNLI